MVISIAGINKAEFLMRLFNAAKPKGTNGIILYTDALPMALSEATEILKKSNVFDYLKGRRLQVDLSTDNFDPTLYEVEVGNGSVWQIIQSIQHQNDKKNIRNLAENSIPEIRSNPVLKHQDSSLGFRWKTSSK
jgi:hypothetical protein